MQIANAPQSLPLRSAQAIAKNRRRLSEFIEADQGYGPPRIATAVLICRSRRLGNYSSHYGQRNIKTCRE